MTDTQPRLETGSGQHPRGYPDLAERSVLAGIDDKEEDALLERARRAAARGPKTTRIVAARVPLRQRLGDLASKPSRELFVYLVRKEIKVKYKNSFLGF